MLSKQKVSTGSFALWTYAMLRVISFCHLVIIHKAVGIISIAHRNPLVSITGVKYQTFYKEYFGSG